MLPLSADCVEQIGSCRGTAAVIQSGPGDWSAADDGGTSERAGRSVLRVFARTSCASGASTAIDRSVCRTRRATVQLAPFYSEKGRPSIDPELMIRMLIVGYCFG